MRVIVKRSRLREQSGNRRKERQLDEVMQMLLEKNHSGQNGYQIPVPNMACEGSSSGVFTGFSLEEGSPIVVRQDKQQYMVHDQLFKRLIGDFFEEFLEAFFPEIHEHIDFQKITPLSEEIFADMYDGNKKVLDLVVEVRWKNTDSLVIVHIEPQSTKQKDFNERMYRYFSLLYNKFRKPIIPIAVFSYDDPWEEKQFSMEFAGIEVFRFNYFTLHVRKQNFDNL